MNDIGVNSIPQLIMPDSLDDSLDVGPDSYVEYTGSGHLTSVLPMEVDLEGKSIDIEMELSDKGKAVYDNLSSDQKETFAFAYQAAILQGASPGQAEDYAMNAVEDADHTGRHQTEGTDNKELFLSDKGLVFYASLSNEEKKEFTRVYNSVIENGGTEQEAESQAMRAVGLGFYEFGMEP